MYAIYYSNYYRYVGVVYNSSIKSDDEGFIVENNICIENPSDSSDTDKIYCDATPPKMKNGCFIRIIDEILWGLTKYEQIIIIFTVKHHLTRRIKVSSFLLVY